MVPLAVPCHAALPDDVLALREKNAVHFLLQIQKHTLTRLDTPNANGTATCHMSGTILERYNMGNSPQQNQPALTEQFAVGGAIEFDVPCSDRDYPVAPGGFGLSKMDIDSPRLELWGEVEGGAEKKSSIFHPFKAVKKLHAHRKRYLPPSLQ